jgi:putative peptide zinc metalloprotease protein
MPTEERPRAVDGIEAAHQTTRGGEPYVVIHNPATHTYLKLEPEEFELLPLMDGSRTVKELVIIYYQRHEVLALPRIAGLVQLLKNHLFLTELPLDAYAELGSRLRGTDAQGLLARIGRGFLQTSIPLPGLDGTVGRIYRAGAWVFFTRPAFLAGAVLGIVSIGLFIYELEVLRYPLFKFGGSYLQGFLLLMLLDLVTISVHELGHAVAMKHAGRWVRRSGLMLYYGMPCAYVDTTDIWMAPRRERLIVSFAGPWTGVWLGAACTIAVLLLPPGSLAGAFFFSWAFVALLDNLFNFCPLLELDGYYLLVDLVEKPMLRARSFAFVRGELWRKLWTREKLEPEERFFASFGIASLAWSAMEIYLAVRVWELRGAAIVREVWASGQWWARLLLIGVGLVIVTPIVLALRSLLLHGLAWARVELGWLRRRAGARVHREALAALRSVPMWAEIPEARLLQIAEAMRPQAVPAGTEVVRQGEVAVRFYVVADGAFEVLVEGRTVGRLGLGDYFGERALLHHAPQAATVVAAEAGRLFWLDQATFHATVEHDVGVRERLEQALAYRSEVAEMPLFRHLAPSDLDLLLARFQPVSAKPGEVVIREGDTGDRFYVIRSGQLRVVRAGRELARLGPGDAVGEMALLLDIPRTATVDAPAGAELLALDADDFHDLLTRYCHRETPLERLSHHRLVAHKRSNQEVSG